MVSGSAVATAYSESARAWACGPARVYRGLAEALVQASPVPLGGRLVLDVGAGTGVAGDAVCAAGGRVVAVDLARGMIAATAGPGVVADVRALPVRTGSVDGAVAAFCL
ncbi:MAG: class I SAM-dependent methyltransferase, partial [Pseudonocardia sp.]|nr:class I SAM-dependent methyltransferase [Pseudonocardia sp.]